MQGRLVVVRAGRWNGRRRGSGRWRRRRGARDGGGIKAVVGRFGASAVVVAIRFAKQNKS
jgi:hypothetical protein